MTSTGRPRASAARPNRQTGARHRTGKYARRRSHSRPAIGAQIIGNCLRRRLGATSGALGAADAFHPLPGACRAARHGAAAVVGPLRRQLPGPRLTLRWRTPSGAKLRCGAPNPRLAIRAGAPGAPCCATGATRRQAWEPARRRPSGSRAGLTHCDGGKGAMCQRRADVNGWRMGRSFWSRPRDASQATRHPDCGVAAWGPPAAGVIRSACSWIQAGPCGHR
jgi:hypothetical protein